MNIATLLGVMLALSVVPAMAESDYHAPNLNVTANAENYQAPPKVEPKPAVAPPAQHPTPTPVTHPPVTSPKPAPKPVTTPPPISKPVTPPTPRVQPTVPRNINTNNNTNHNTNNNQASAASASGAYAGGSYAGGSSAVTNNSYTGGGGYSGVNIDQRSAPTVFVPSVGGGGADCPVVGFGIGGSGLGGGGGFGPTWISPDCNARHTAELLARLGHPDAAVALLAGHDPEVRRALESTRPEVVAPSVAPVAANTVPDWCYTASPSERAHHPQCHRS